MEFLKTASMCYEHRLTDLISECLAEDDLRGHPVGRPDEGVPPLVHLAVLGRDAKVGQLHLAVVRQEHVT